MWLPYFLIFLPAEEVEIVPAGLRGVFELTTYIEWQADLPFDAQQRREVFARFGLAMYHSQCVEKQIWLMLSSMYNQEFIQVPSEDRDDFFGRNISKTLGQMARELEDKSYLSETLETRLRKAVNLRNKLAHSYFYKRAKDILQLEGRGKMIIELNEVADFLNKLDEELTQTLKMWMNKMGITNEEIQSEFDKFIATENTKTRILDNIEG